MVEHPRAAAARPSPLVVLMLLTFVSATPIRTYAQATAGASRAQRAVPSSVHGTVYDSVAGAPLVRAVVQLLRDTHASGQGRSVYTATTDAAGTYRMPDVAPGRYRATFFHPVLDALGLHAAERSMIVAAGMPSRLDFAVPSPSTIWALTCTPASSSDSTGLLIGHVRDAETGAPVTGAQVSVNWTELVLLPEERSLRNEPEHIATTSDESGLYGICGLPTRGTVSALAMRGTATSGPLALEVPARGLLQADLFISSANTRVARAADSAGAGAGTVLLHGTARLSGSVQTPTGQPLADVQLLLLGSGVRGHTASDGTFLLTDLPAGSYTLETRRLGLAPKRTVVTLASDRTARVVVSMNEAVILDAVTIYGKSQNRVRMQRLSGFLQRERVQSGHFITRADIERQQPFETSDLLRTLPGVIMVTGNDLQERLLVRGSMGKVCEPNIFLDGIAVFRSPGASGALTGAGSDLRTLKAASTQGTASANNTASTDGGRGAAGAGGGPAGSLKNVVDAYIIPGDIAAIEVYPTETAVPAEFRAGDCGSVVLWSRYAFPDQQRADSAK